MGERRDRSVRRRRRDQQPDRLHTRRRRGQCGGRRIIRRHQCASPTERKLCRPDAQLDKRTGHASRRGHLGQWRDRNLWRHLSLQQFGGNHDRRSRRRVPHRPQERQFCLWQSQLDQHEHRRAASRRGNLGRCSDWNHGNDHGPQFARGDGTVQRRRWWVDRLIQRQLCRQQ